MDILKYVLWSLLAVVGLSLIALFLLMPALLMYLSMIAI